MSNLRDKTFLSMMGLVPKRLLSHATGRLMSLKVPKPLRRSVLGGFSSLYKIDLEAADRHLEEYESINALFTRRLKEGARPVKGDVVHPADGKIISSGSIELNRIYQVKGLNYDLPSFLGDETFSSRLQGGYFWTTYLSPRDYHRVHFPISGNVVGVRRIQGNLWPVNEAFYRNFENLFLENERVVVFLETKMGPAAVVMVGATNVGHIEVHLEKKLALSPESFGSPEPVSCGDELGAFHFGSTTVTLFGPEMGSLLKVDEGSSVRWGQSALRDLN